MKKLFIPPSLLFYSLFFCLICFFVLPSLNVIPFPYNLLGILVAFSGFFLMGKARDLFRSHKTTLKIEQSSNLIKTGVFSKTRNPMYLGMLILILGACIFSCNIISFSAPLLFFILVNWYFIPKEEHLMKKEFKSEYEQYQKQVKKWL